MDPLSSLKMGDSPRPLNGGITPRCVSKEGGYYFDGTHTFAELLRKGEIIRKYPLAHRQRTRQKIIHHVNDGHLTFCLSYLLALTQGGNGRVFSIAYFFYWPTRVYEDRVLMVITWCDFLWWGEVMLVKSTIIKVFFQEDTGIYGINIF